MDVVEQEAASTSIKHRKQKGVTVNNIQRVMQNKRKVRFLLKSVEMIKPQERYNVPLYCSCTSDMICVCRPCSSVSIVLPI